MEKSHRNNVLVTSCLKTPVDPHRKVPLAQYERDRSLPRALAVHADNRNYEKEMEYDSGSDVVCDDDRTRAERTDLRNFFFSNQEYYRKLQHLKAAHLHTMTELEQLYRNKLHLQHHTLHHSHRPPQGLKVLTSSLHKAQSALELSYPTDFTETLKDEHADFAQEDLSTFHTETDLPPSPKDLIKNMWKDFDVTTFSSPQHCALSSSLQNLSTQCQAKTKNKYRKKKSLDDNWHPKATIPIPFQMTLREAEHRKKGVKTRSEIERENAELRRLVEELTECQKKFRASPVPAHVHLPLYEELQQRPRLHRDQPTSQKPFRFLERERLKKEQKEAKLRELMLQHHKEEKERRKCPFKAKPVPKAVKDTAFSDQLKEEELYRNIKIKLRAQDMLHSASMPPSMEARHLREKKMVIVSKDNRQTHRPAINTEVPDFDASYRRFQNQLAKRKDLRPSTTCEPFHLRTANISSHKERIMADIEAEMQSPKSLRWPYVPQLDLSPRTSSSSLCSSLSGSQDCLSAKITDATKKRQEAVRKVLEQRKQAEDEEENWKRKQKEREKKLQKVVTKRAQANDPQVTLSQTTQTKLDELRKQDLTRRREYQEEMRAIQQRVKGRPLLLEQVAQMNAKRAAEKLYSTTLHDCGVSESFISSKAPIALISRQSPSSSHIDSQTPPTPYRREEPVELPHLWDSQPEDYPEDYEEYDPDMEPGDVDDKHGSGEEKEDDGHSYVEDAHEDDDSSSNNSKSSGGYINQDNHHSDTSRTSSVQSFHNK